MRHGYIIGYNNNDIISYIIDCITVAYRFPYGLHHGYIFGYIIGYTIGYIIGYTTVTLSVTPRLHYQLHRLHHQYIFGHIVGYIIGYIVGYTMVQIVDCMVERSVTGSTISFTTFRLKRHLSSDITNVIET